MPDPNNPLETALRQIKDHLLDADCLTFSDQEQIRVVMTPIRAILINYHNRASGLAPKLPPFNFCDRCLTSYTTKCQCD